MKSSCIDQISISFWATWIQRVHSVLESEAASSGSTSERMRLNKKESEEWCIMFKPLVVIPFYMYAGNKIVSFKMK